jgi:N-methylhydantoinase A
MSDERFRVGVDIGGTFTDCVVVSSTGRSLKGKVPTTPEDRSIGFFNSIDSATHGTELTLDAVLRSADWIVHGTTVGTNAIGSQTGARVGLLATAGHGDCLFVANGRGRLPGRAPEQLLDLVQSSSKPAPLVPKTMIAEVPGRIDKDGEVIQPLDEARAASAVRELIAAGAESIAVSFLWSIRNPSHEQRVQEIVAELAPEMFVCCGADLVKHLGEYERTTAVVMNAYIGPLMVRYISEIEDRARDLGYIGDVLFAQCAGGAISAAEARRAPILTVNSGPVAGVVQSQGFGHQIGESNLITADMGGTTFDVAVVSGASNLTREITELGGYELALPMMDIESVGAGGGSIAWIDDSGRLNVGPQSAGAVPGPACYGRGGTVPTVTDADVVLGIIPTESYLHGDFTIHRNLAEESINALARPLGISLMAAAAGISKIVDAKMADLIQRMTQYRGHDPKDFVMVAFGGAGPVHASRCARDAGLRRVVVPNPVFAPVWSAGGTATADVTRVLLEPLVAQVPDQAGVLRKGFEELEARAAKGFGTEGFDFESTKFERYIRMKYVAQIFDLGIPVPYELHTPESMDRLLADFIEAYLIRFGAGSEDPSGIIQSTGLELRATAVMGEAPSLLRSSSGVSAVPDITRRVYWDELSEVVETRVIKATAGDADLSEPIVGPALIDFPDTVIVVRPRQTATSDSFGNIFIDL